MYCLWDSKGWQCPLCLHRNKIDKSVLDKRYATSINRSRCEECLYSTYSMDIPISKMMHVLLGFVTSRHPPLYKDNAREVLVLVIDCTGFASFLEYIKSVLKELIENYSDRVDLRMDCCPSSPLVLFTSSDRLGLYNIKHSMAKVLVLTWFVIHRSIHVSLLPTSILTTRHLPLLPLSLSVPSWVMKKLHRISRSIGSMLWTPSLNFVSSEANCKTNWELIK